jgi:hypothetical protein
MNTINKEIVEKILASNGKIFTVTFTKKDGTERVLNGRLGVTKHLRGGTNKLDADKFITVYDMQAKGYRAVNRDTITSVTGL